MDTKIIGNKKIVVCLVALLAVSVPLALAAYIVYGAPSQTVTLDYQLSEVEVCTRGADFTVTSILTNGGSPVKFASVDFYVSVDGGAWEFIGSDTTDFNGVAALDYSATSNGDYVFKSAFQVS